MAQIIYMGSGTTADGTVQNFYTCSGYGAGCNPHIVAGGSSYDHNQVIATAAGTACSCGAHKGFGDPACSGLGLFTTTRIDKSFCDTCQTAYQAPALMPYEDWPKFTQCGAKNQIIKEEVYNEIINQLNAFYTAIDTSLKYIDPADNKKHWVGGITYPTNFQEMVNKIPNLVSQSSEEIINENDVSLSDLTEILNYFSDFENRQNATTPTESEQIYGEYTSQIQTYMKNSKSGKNTLKFQYPTGLKYLACNCEKVCYDDCHGHAGSG